MQPTNFIRVVVVVFCVASFAPAGRADCPLEESGHWGGAVREMIDHDGLLYAAVGRRLDVIDASIPSSPTRIGYWTTTKIIEGLALETQTAYVASAVGLEIVDLSNPAAPRTIGLLEQSGLRFKRAGLFVAHGYAYGVIESSPRQLIVVDVADPYSPQVSALLELPDPVVELAGIYESHLYARQTSGGLLVFDLATPQAPVLLGYALADETVRSIDFDGVVPVAAIEGRGLVTLDFGNPLLPEIVGQSDALGSVSHVRARQARVVAVAYSPQRALGVFSLDRTSAPQLRGRMDDETGFGSAVLGEEYVAAVRFFQGPEFFANPLPNVLYRVGRYFDAQAVESDMAAEGEYLYIPSNDMLKIVRAVGVDAPHTVATYQLPPFVIPGYTDTDSAQHVVVNNGFAYLSTALRGLLVLDVSDPTSPQLVNELGHLPRFGCVRDGRAYTLGDVMQIYDLADPIAPRFLGEAQLEVPAIRVAVDGPLACLSGFSKFMAVDVSDPTAPIVRLTRPADYYLPGIAINGSIAFIARENGLMEALDLSDPDFVISRYVHGDFEHGSAGALAIRDGILYAGMRGGLWVGDLANPFEPRLLARQNVGGRSGGIGLLNGYAAVSDPAGGVSIVPLPLAGDIDGDRDVDLVDLGQLLSLVGQFVGGGPGNGDFNCDGWVDLSDLTTLLSTFGTRR